MHLLLEKIQGQLPPTLYYFRGLRGAENILETGTLLTSDTHIAADRAEKSTNDRFISFTTDSSFLNGFPSNQRVRQSYVGALGDTLYKDISHFPLVRFTIDTKKLEELAEQATGDSRIEDFSFSFSEKDQKRGSDKPENEKRVWLKRRTIKDFPECIKEICLLDFYTGSPKYNRIARNIIQLAEEYNIPCYVDFHFTRQNGGIFSVEDVFKSNLYKSFGNKYTATASYEKTYTLGPENLKILCGIVAICAYKFINNKAGFYDYVGRRFSNIGDFENDAKFTKFLAGIYDKIEEFSVNPDEINRVIKNARFIQSREFKGSPELRHSIQTMIERACEAAKVKDFKELATQVQNQIKQSNSMNETFRGTGYSKIVKEILQPTEEKNNEESEKWVVTYKDEDGEDKAYFNSEAAAYHWIETRETRRSSGEKFILISVKSI